MNYKRFDYVKFKDMTGQDRTGRIVDTRSKYWGIRGDYKFNYLMPIEVYGKGIVGYKRASDTIEYFVDPGSILGYADDPRAVEVNT